MIIRSDPSWSPPRVVTGDKDSINPLTAEFDRGWQAAADSLAGEYARGFTDALMVAFFFFALGAAVTAAIVAVFA